MGHVGPQAHGPSVGFVALDSDQLAFDHRWVSGVWPCLAEAASVGNTEIGCEQLLLAFCSWPTPGLRLVWLS